MMKRITPHLIIINIHESNGELWFQVLEAQQRRSRTAGHKLEGRRGERERGGEGERGGEERGRGRRGDAALFIAASFQYALHLKEEPLLLFVEVTAENIPEPQDHSVSGMVPSVVHRVVPGEEEGGGGGGGEGSSQTTPVHCNT